MDAEKAIADVDDVVVSGRLQSCLTLISVARRSRQAKAESIASKRDAPVQRIAELDASIKAADESVSKFKSEAAGCIAQAK